MEARIKQIKENHTPADAESLMKDWDADKHDVMDTTIRKNRRIVVKPEVTDANGKVIESARYQEEPVNRITLPLEQDIVNIQTAFTVGNEPSLTCKTNDKPQTEFFDIIKRIHRQNKTRYLNKRIMRAWLAETEVAEYWYTVDDNNWWRRILKLVGAPIPTKRLKVALWSPFRGDKLYPEFNNQGDLISFSREYVIKEDGKDITKLMFIDDKQILIFTDDELTDSIVHGFGKIPVIYMNREKPYCHKIKTIRNRIETLLSNYADCLDYNFFPKLTAKGVVENIINRNTGSEIIQLENGAEIAYLTWQQSPEMAKMELDNLTERAYAMTNTPRVSLDYMKGLGGAVSGKAFRFVFMGAHMQVSNHAEDVEEYLQRRVNFLIHAVGVLYPRMAKVSDEIDIEVEIEPFIIDNRSEDIDDAVKAYGGGVASQKQGIILAGLTDAIEDELLSISKQEVDKKTEEEPKSVNSVK